MIRRWSQATPDATGYVGLARNERERVGDGGNFEPRFGVEAVWFAYLCRSLTESPHSLQ